MATKQPALPAASAYAHVTSSAELHALWLETQKREQQLTNEVTELETKLAVLRRELTFKSTEQLALHRRYINALRHENEAARKGRK